MSTDSSSTENTPEIRRAIERLVETLADQPMVFSDIYKVPMGSTGYFSPSGKPARFTSKGWFGPDGNKSNLDGQTHFTAHSGPANRARLAQALLERFTINNPAGVTGPIRHFHIWIEGHAATGSSSAAERLTEAHIAAPSFNEAVAQYVAGLTPKDQAWWSQAENGQWSMWGCAAFPDEASARAFMG